MENSSLSPTNKFSTSWRRAAFFFDWQDEALVEEAIETLSPLKITVKYRFVGVVGVETDADIVMHFLADTLPPRRRFDNEHSCAVIDPCTDPEALRALVEYEIPQAQFSVFGVGFLDLADQETYELLLTALADRGGQFVGEMPCIEF
jgi:hypothetical protein